VPVDAANTSASGLDPDISVANADIQAHRIAAVRHLPMATVLHLVSQNTTGRGLGFSGEPGVDVLDLNLALDRLTGARA
jgi:K+-transporting ATPase ATPase C chain